MLLFCLNFSGAERERKRIFLIVHFFSSSNYFLLVSNRLNHSIEYTKYANTHISLEQKELCSDLFFSRVCCFIAIDFFCLFSLYSKNKIYFKNKSVFFFLRFVQLLWKVALCKKMRIGDEIHLRIHYYSISTTNRIKEHQLREQKKQKGEENKKKTVWQCVQGS